MARSCVARLLSFNGKKDEEKGQKKNPFLLADLFFYICSKSIIISRVYEPTIILATAAAEAQESANGFSEAKK